MFSIRTFASTDEEYTRIVEIYNALWPGEPLAAENLKYEDATRAPDRFLQRLMIELDDPSACVDGHRKIIGEAWCGQKEYESDTSRYEFGIHVDPLYAHLEYGEKGICPAAMTALLIILKKRDPKPTLLITYWREDRPDRLSFLKAFGFTEVMRYQDSELEVTTFDPSPFMDKIRQVESLGIEILALPELQSRYHDWMERIYTMDMEILPDEPGIEEFMPDPIEEYAKMFDHPAFMADGWFVAVDGDICVGSSSVRKNAADAHRLDTNFTGVRRAYRRKGITTALKLATIAFAQQRGVTRIVTNNEENNPMYQINVQFGFKPLPGWLEYHKKI